MRVREKKEEKVAEKEIEVAETMEEL